MPYLLIVYHARTGGSRQMAEAAGAVDVLTSSGDSSCKPRAVSKVGATPTKPQIGGDLAITGPSAPV